MESITVSAKPEVLDSVVEFITARLTRCGCSEDVQLEVRLAVEEIFVNITSYAYHPQDGEAEIRCDVLEDPLRVVVQILDSGRPFDPLARERAVSVPAQMAQCVRLDPQEAMTLYSLLYKLLGMEQQDNK